MIKVDVAPVSGIVTIGALPLIVVRRRIVARLAINKAAVVNADFVPVIGVVTGGTLSFVVVVPWRFVTG